MEKFLLDAFLINIGECYIIWLLYDLLSRGKIIYKKNFFIIFVVSVITALIQQIPELISSPLISFIMTFLTMPIGIYVYWRFYNKYEGRIKLRKCCFGFILYIVSSLIILIIINIIVGEHATLSHKGIIFQILVCYIIRLIQFVFLYIINYKGRDCNA